MYLVTYLINFKPYHSVISIFSGGRQGERKKERERERERDYREREKELYLRNIVFVRKIFEV